MGFLGISILELNRGTRQTDRRTDSAAQSAMPRPLGRTGAGHNNVCDDEDDELLVRNVV